MLEAVPIAEKKKQPDGQQIQMNPSCRITGQRRNDHDHGQQQAGMQNGRQYPVVREQVAQRPQHQLSTVQRKHRQQIKQPDHQVRLEKIRPILGRLARSPFQHDRGEQGHPHILQRTA
ncbi:hypothetical protein D3C75_961830 [compost metagenome]